VRLPEENALELPPENLLVVDATDPPALTKEEVASLAPAWVRRGRAALRETVFRGFSRLSLLAWGALGRVVAASASPRFAEGERLRAWGTMFRRPAVTGEADHELRARLLNPPARVTPSAIQDAVNALVLAETPIAPNFIEPADDMFFVGSSTSPWICFVQPVAGRLWAYDPSRPDARWGTYWHPARLTPEFWVVLQGDVSGDEEVVFFLDVPVTPAAPADAVTDYIGPFPSSLPWGYLSPAEDSLEARVEREVETRRMYGVLWALLIDPYLETAR
jgi:hypothetical protein